ncbi:MAG: hypothetical protein EOP60_07520 [Sphingomonadales bacterium]|nr:MAG: hypothetical protein EOP60_07520 [Sphingomonadales bacterium]
MKFVILAAVAMLSPTIAFAQDAPAAAPAQTAPAAKFNLDTPIETIVADEKAYAALTAAIGDVVANPAYESFKKMSLNQAAPYAPDKLPPEMLKKIEGDLAAVK